MPVQLQREEFDQAVEAALETIPPNFREAMENLVISVLDEPLPEHLEGFEDEGYNEGGEGDLLGLYVGTPLPERSTWDSGFLSDQVFLFQGPLQRMCQSREELIEEIRITLIHEVGHFFGLNEDEIVEVLGP